MPEGTGKKRRVVSTPHNALMQVKRLKHRKRFFIRYNALQDARKDFGWNTQDIVDALNKLQNKHYYKTDPSKYRPGVMIDVYRARGLKGEDVYTHFYVDPNNGKLIINSFKRLT